MYWFPRSLPFRLVSRLVLVNLLLVPALYFGISKVSENAINDNFENQVRFDSLLISTITQPLLLQNDAVSIISDLFTDILLGGQAAYLEIKDHRHIIVSEEFEPAADENLHFSSIPMGNNAQYNNIILRIGFDKSPMLEQLALAKQSCLVISIFFSLLSLGITFALTYQLIRPIRQLQYLSQNIASGDMDQPLVLQSSIQEIKQLSKGMESMRLSLRKHSQHMEYAALHDDLTGLPNRRMLYDCIDNVFLHEQSATNTFPFSLILIDVNNFKDINDSYGHHIGDETLIQVAKRIQSTLHNNEIFARLGGDEFAILIKGQQQAQAIKSATKIHQALFQELEIGEIKIRLGISTGIALFPKHADDRTELLKKADLAMYASKRENHIYTVYDDALLTQNKQQMNMRNELRHSIENQLFELYYQPQICLQTGQLQGFEALCRWQHPEHGGISPEVFIPVLEEMRLINQLSELVIDKALKQLSVWKQHSANLQISINVSPFDLLDSNFSTVLVEKLQQYDLSPKNIELEITESANITDNARTRSTLEALHNHGIKLAIDDFGTGYTSLSYLKDFPINTLKIDKSFVSSMLLNQDDLRIVEATINLAHTFGLSVVAEGIENQETLQKLKDLRCETAQGYYLSKPLAPPQATEFIHSFQSLRDELPAATHWQEQPVA